MTLYQDPPIRVFFDESGYTGVDLHSNVQPLYALASTCLSDREAADILPPLRKGQVEIKYSKLRARENGRKEILRIFSSGVLTPENIRVCLTHKRFYLASQLVDKLIEPGLYQVGIDIYDRDGAVNLARVWHYAGKYIFPGGHWDNVLSAFECALRERDSASFAEFDRVLLEAVKQSNPSCDDLVGWLYVSRGRLNEYLGVFDHQTAFDPSVDSFVALVSDWMKMTSGMIEAVHDDTKPLNSQSSLIAALRKLDLEARIIGSGERKMELPLRLTGLSFSSSTEHSGLQLADLVAGAIIDCTLAASGEREKTEHHDALLETGLMDFVTTGVMPIPHFQAGPAREPGELSLVDGATKFLVDANYFRGE